MIVSDRSFTVIMKGMTKEYGSDVTQRKLFNVIENAVPKLVSRSEQLWDPITMETISVGAGVSSSYAFAEWPVAQGGRNDDRDTGRTTGSLSGRLWRVSSRRPSLTKKGERTPVWPSRSLLV